MLSLVALDVTSSIDYGTVAPGNDSSEQTTTITATGNVGLDAQYSGTDMTSGGDTISVSQQKYDLTSGNSWDSMAYTLSTSATERELDCSKTTDHTSPCLLYTSPSPRD